MDRHERAVFVSDLVSVSGDYSVKSTVTAGVGAEAGGRPHTALNHHQALSGRVLLVE